ncbi:MAG: transposase [Candidatus Competibacteraceae bacterium]|nr:transposase [Candidatus Competibacteraceae bacterium]
MTTIDFITELFCRIDDQMHPLPKHPQAMLWPSEVVTLGVLHALKGVGNRAFYRWLTRDYLLLFPHLPERTRLFRSFKTHHLWTHLFLAPPTLLGIVDSYGIELIHPIREGRSPAQIGRKGVSNHRWIVGYKLCLLANCWGGIVGWLCAPDQVHDTVFHPLINVFKDRMRVLADTGFHAHEGDPPHLKLCPRGTWNNRMLIETLFSMLTLISHTKKMMHRVAEYLEARLAFTVAAFNLRVQWNGMKPDPDGFIPLSIAEFNL